MSLLERGGFPRAAAEINLIHNIPLAVGEAWDLAHFLQIELPTYLDEDIDLPRLKQLLSDVGRLVS